MSDKGDLVKEVMEKIKKEKILIRSKYIILAQKLGLGSSLVLSLVIASIFINFSLYWLKVSSNLEFLSFGSRGVLAFLESFEYLWILAGIVFFVIASLLLKKYDISYKKSYKLLVAGFLALVFIVGGVMAFSGANEKLAGEVDKGRMRFLRVFYKRRFGVRGRNGLAGEVVRVERNGLRVKINGDEIEVVFSKKTQFLKGRNFSKGDMVRVVGRYKEGRFEADRVGRTGGFINGYREARRNKVKGVFK